MKRSGPRLAPIFSAFVRPPTILGCDPRVISVSATLAAFLILPVGLMRTNVTCVVLGVVLLVGTVGLCNVLNKRDPQWLDVWFRSLQYKRSYDRTARWDRRPPRRRQW